MADEATVTPESTPEPEGAVETVSKAEYEQIKAEMAKHKQLAKLGQDMFERLSVLRDSNQAGYEQVRALLEGRATSAASPAASHAGEDVGMGDSVIDDDTRAAIFQTVQQAISQHVNPLKQQLTSMSMEGQLSALRAKYGNDAVDANQEDLIRAIDENPGILNQRNGLDLLFRSVDHDKVATRLESKRKADEEAKRSRLERTRGLPSGNLGGRKPERELKSFQDMFDYASEVVASNGSRLED